MATSSETLLPRYERVRVIGRGGMGAIWLVEDAERGERVAMKRVLGVHGEALVRFKREFRAVESLLHPNVVRLYELGEDGGGLFFTMEAVEGTDLSSWCRGVRPPPQESGTHARRDSASDTLAAAPTLGSDEAAAIAPGRAQGALRPDRLAHVLPQLVEALAFLHGQGIVHRDLKPSNVMVTNDGILKILDFGILGEHGARATEDAEIVGTVGYMSVEQIRGEPPAPANDLYALGCMLFEIASGTPPFRGAPFAVMNAQLSSEPPSLSDVDPGAPPALVDACAALMRRAPSERPALRELASTLLPALGARVPAFPPPRPARVALVGRGREVGMLVLALDRIAGGSFEALALAGPTGAGKTALAAAATEEAARRGMTVLRGRGRATERVAFNAVDGAIDELASVLGRRARRESAAIGRARRSAAAAFPALTRRRESADSVPPPSSRGQVFGAIVTLLEAVAREGEGLVVWVDDLQWADRDSLSLLEHLVESAPKRVLLLSTLRDDVGESPASEWVRAREDVRVVPVEPLDADAICEVIRRTIEARRGQAPGEEAVRRLATRCEGRPFLAELAGRAIESGAAEASPESWLEREISGQNERARSVVGLLVAADGWVQLGELAAVSARAPGEVEDDVKQLEMRGLVRRAGAPGPTGSADLYHDVVRGAAVRALGAGATATAHARFAEHLARTGGPAHERVRHLLGAGRTDEAARLAPEAARDAEALRAYGLAADMYEVALAGSEGDRPALRRARAAALERGGRYLEASREWRAVAESGGDEAVDAVLHEAHALLAANDVAAGRRRLDEGLRASGEPAAGRAGIAALLSGIGFLRGPGPVRAAAREVDAAALARAERDVRIGTMVTYFDPLSGIRFLRRARAAFASQGAALEAAKADWVFAYLALFSTRTRGRVKLADAYAASATAWLERVEREDPVAGAYPAFHAGVAAQRNGAWDEATEALDRAIDTLERAGLTGTFEHMLARVHRAQIDLYGQRLDRARESVQHLAEAGRESADTAIACHVAMSRATEAALHGDFDRALAIVEPIAATWDIDEPTFQRVLVDVIQSLPSVFLGGAAKARAELDVAFRRARRFRPLATMYAGSIGSLRAIVEAAALRTGDRGASGRRVLRLAALAREAPPLGTGLGLRAAAYVEDARGRPERAVARLEEARRTAERWSQALDAAVAGYQLGRRLGGDGGAALVAGARETCRAMGVAELLLDEDPGLT